jgi:Ni,Fe-hydrogenase maturation factor
VEGLDEEIALLRVKLGQALAQHPENTELLLKGVGMLVRAVATKYRLSPRARENLTEAITQVLKEVGGALFPEGFSSTEG